MAQEQIEQLMQDADKLLDDGKFTEAEAIYSKVLEETPEHDSALAMLGAVYGELGDLPKAVEALEKATKINENNADAWLTLGLIQEHTGDFAQSIASIKNASKHAPDDAEIYFILGNILLKNDQQQESLASYVEAVRYNPQHVQALYSSGCLFQNTGDYANAASGFQAIIDLEPEHLEARQRLSNMLLKLERYDEAEKATLDAIKQFPDDPWLHARLATVYATIINLPEAINSIKRARELESGNDEIEQRYADILSKQGEYEESLSVLQPMLDRDEPAFGAVMNFSQFAAEIDKQDLAESLLKKLKKSDELTDVQHDSVTRALVQIELQIH